MSTNRFVTKWEANVNPVGCAACLDIRFVETSSGVRRRCPVCGCKCLRDRNGEVTGGKCAGCLKSDELVAIAYRKLPLPELTVEGLDAEDRAFFEESRVRYPRASTLTLLSWVEGRHYDTALDARLHADVDKEIARFHAWRDTHLEQAGRRDGQKE